jgi:hypothetical protein
MAAMRQKRQERLETALATLEAEFRTRLIKALRRCEQGSWGLFGQNDQTALSDRLKQEIYATSGAQELDALGAEIAQIGDELGMAEPFALYAEFKQKRGRNTQNDLGEPRLAAAWLQELGA